MARVRLIGCVHRIAAILAMSLAGCAALPSQPTTPAAGADATTILSSDPTPSPTDAKTEPRPADTKSAESPVIPDLAAEPAPKAADKSPIDARLRGRIEADADFVGQSGRSKQIVGSVDDATGFRRARLGGEGTFGEQLSWVAEFDFAGGQIAFKDVYGQVDELPVVRRLRFGHMIEPFSLEGQTSSNYFAFTERSTIMPLDPARNWGVEMLSYAESERATLQSGVFRTGSGNSGDDTDTHNDIAYDLRATWLPWYDDADGLRLWHVGGAFSQRAPPNDVVTVNSGPQSSLVSTSDNPGSPFTPVITIPAHSQQLYNLQTALVLDSLSFQAEWTGSSIEQIGGGTVFLNGAYGFASWFLTGEHRSYDTKNGAFGVTKVLSPFVCMGPGKHVPMGTGAIELVARFAYINYADPNIPMSNGLKVGDREATTTLGVNWYLCDNVRLMCDWVHAIPVDPNFGPSYADLVTLRTAIFW